MRSVGTVKNRCKNRNSKPTLWSPTSDFAYWDTFSTPNSNVFVQENGLNFWKSLMFSKKRLLKKFSNSNSRSVYAKNTARTKLPNLHLTHHFDIWSKKIFLKILKISIIFFTTYGKNYIFWKSFFRKMVSVLSQVRASIQK